MKIQNIIILILAVCIGIISAPFVYLWFIVQIVKTKIRARAKRKHAKSSLPLPLIDCVDDFIDSHYEFRCNPKYKGVFGKIRAFTDRSKYEQQDHFSPRELHIPEPEGIIYNITVLYGSDPHSKDQFETKRLENEEIERKNNELIKATREQFLTEESFSAILMKYITSKDMNAIEVYKKANIDRKLFSKIRSNTSYMPSKRTAVSLAMALELSFDETNDLLKRAGFTLSRSLLFDVIIEYFITQGKYNVYEINEVLLIYKQPLLGE